ncbi:MAG TPA: GNAT family N-acetyltransferase [Dehalococcoidia bacterium]|nr:GNAT family N-acetyltransferase [Dehalococcoidia bacterium]
MPPVSIRPATRADVPLLLGFIRALAEYEREPQAVVATEADLDRWLFGERPAAEVVFAAIDGVDAGFALYFPNFSTWLGRPGLYLEDLFVLPEYRRRGLGRALLAHLARICIERGYGRLEWSVLDWNEPSIAFYKSLGAKAMDEWTTYRLEGEALRRLAVSPA